MGHRMANCPKLEKQKMKVIIFLISKVLTNPSKDQCPDFLHKKSEKNEDS